MYFVIDFFSASRFKKNAELGQPGLTSAAPAPSAKKPEATTAGATGATSAVSSISNTWRLVGSLQAQGKHFIVLEGQGGRIRLEHPSAFMNAGASMVGEIDGQRITVWSGARPIAGVRP